MFSLGGALGIGLLGRRGRHDVATALTLVFMLGLGALFLSFSVEYAPEIYSLLFGEVLGISTNQLAPTIALAAASLAALALLYRPLLLTSILPDSAQARGIAPFAVELGFLALVALATTMTVPVVGTALIFSLMIGPPAAARAFTARPHVAIALSIAIAPRRRLGRDRALLPNQLARRLLRRSHQRDLLRHRPRLDIHAPPPTSLTAHPSPNPTRPRPATPCRPFICPRKCVGTSERDRYAHNHEKQGQPEGQQPRVRSGCGANRRRL